VLKWTEYRGKMWFGAGQVYIFTTEDTKVTEKSAQGRPYRTDLTLSFPESSSAFIWSANPYSTATYCAPPINP